MKDIIQISQLKHSGDHNETTKKIKDSFAIHHIYFLMLGTLTYLPIFFFITANDYWMYKFRNPNTTDINEDRNELQKNFTSTYSITRSVTTACCMLLGMVLSKRVSLQIRIPFCLTLILAMFIVDIILVNVNTDAWQKTFFICTMVLTVFTSAPADVLFVSLLQFSIKFPSEYFGSYLAGDVICGIGSGVVQIMCLYLGRGSISTGMIYFSIGAAFIVMSFALHLIVAKTEYYKHHMDAVRDGNAVEKFDLAMIKKVTKDNIVPLVGTVTEYVTTVISTGTRSLVISEGKGNGNPWNDVYFVPVVTFLSFNIVNLAGKVVAINVKPRNRHVLCVLSFVRLAMVILFMLCNAYPRTYLPVVFNKDYQYIIITLVFGFSGGFLNGGQILLTARESAPQEQYLATFILIYISTIFIGIFSFTDVLLINLL